jgi:hypothetical protein
VSPAVSSIFHSSKRSANIIFREKSAVDNSHSPIAAVSTETLFFVGTSGSHSVLTFVAAVIKYLLFFWNMSNKYAAGYKTCPSPAEIHRKSETALSSSQRTLLRRQKQANDSGRPEAANA